VIKPLHEQVRLEIAAMIGTGHYRPGDALPSAARLSRQFDVSAITVKRALRDLHMSGVLRSIAGRGTFVKERQRFVRDLTHSFNSVEDARRLGVNMTIELIGVTREKISEPSLGHFGPPDTSMLCVRKIIKAEDASIMHDTTYVRAGQLNEQVIDQFAEGFVIEALTGAGFAFDRNRLLIDASAASPQAQSALDLPAGYPTLRRLYAMDSSLHDVAIFGIAEAPFDRLSCELELRLEPGGAVASSTAISPFRPMEN
jgi:DNA-binding GntR family transcriptional regulator